jgi:hypothetical protein
MSYSNNGIPVKKMSRQYIEFNDKIFTTLAFVLYVKSLFSFISHWEIPKRIIKKTYQFSEKVEYNAIKVLLFKANSSFFMLFTAFCIFLFCFWSILSYSYGKIQNFQLWKCLNHTEPILWISMFNMCFKA